MVSFGEKGGGKKRLHNLDVCAIILAIIVL